MKVYTLRALSILLHYCRVKAIHVFSLYCDDFCPVNEMSFQQLPNVQFSTNLAKTRESIFPWTFSKGILQNFSFRVICLQKNSNLKGDQTGTSLWAAYSARTHCREISFTPFCSSKAIHCSSGRSRGMPFASGVFLRLLLWELRIPKFSPMGNVYISTQC